MAYDSENYVVTDLPQPLKLSPEAREALVVARGLIEAGWCQNRSHAIVDGKDHYCIIGALFLGSAPASVRAGTEEACTAIGARLGGYDGLDSIATFNDTSTKAEVLKLFDDTLEAAE